MSETQERTTCLFCRIVDGAIPATIVYHDAETVAFRDVNPQAPVHILVVPRQHIANAVAAPHSLWQSMMTAATTVAGAEGLHAPGYRLVINSGPAAGQSVDHLHVHVLGGRSLAWPPG